MAPSPKTLHVGMFLNVPERYLKPDHPLSICAAGAQCAPCPLCTVLVVTSEPGMLF